VGQTGMALTDRRWSRPPPGRDLRAVGPTGRMPAVNTGIALGRLLCLAVILGAAIVLFT